MIAIVVADKIGGMAQWNFTVVRYATHHIKKELSFILVHCIDDHSNYINEKEYEDLNVIQFKYSGLENNYIVRKRLSQLLMGYDLVICNDQLELSALSLLKKRPKIIANIADWYNLTYTSIYYQIIDAYVTLSSQFEDVLNSSAQYRIAKFLPHGVPVEKEIVIQKNLVLNLIFLGRLVETKGCLKLIDLENYLKENNIKTNWKIIGSGPEDIRLKEQWHGKENVHFITPISNDEVIKALSGGDILVLPSEFEGYGIAILEAMSKGVIPAVYRLPIGVTNQLNFRNSIMVDLMDFETLVRKITELSIQKDKLELMKYNCHQTILNDFNIQNTSNSYFDFYYAILNEKSININTFNYPFKESILDSTYCPNYLSRFMRKLKKYAFN